MDEDRFQRDRLALLVELVSELNDLNRRTERVVRKLLELAQEYVDPRADSDGALNNPDNVLTWPNHPTDP